jgi:hypothetical protein
MENVTFVDLTDVMSDEIKTFAIITNEDGSTTSMLKSTYEAQQAEQSTPIVINEAEAK